MLERVPRQKGADEPYRSLPKHGPIPNANRKQMPLRPWQSGANTPSLIHNRRDLGTPQQGVIPKKEATHALSRVSFTQRQAAPVRPLQALLWFQAQALQVQEQRVCVPHHHERGSALRVHLGRGIRRVPGCRVQPLLVRVQNLQPRVSTHHRVRLRSEVHPLSLPDRASRLARLCQPHLWDALPFQLQGPCLPGSWLQKHHSFCRGIEVC
mmetsp:Transcript_17287/g.46858  ORF Transcript_17287/g.46858 Transcript_17287/m.46858 type:complete len:210 (-) Transcript_17287:1054-1683(-)